ncbi:hypothetical protein I5907_21300 [Panacibacter sp. DH6]|uniref:Uncharacterized protein n=1 Tax=Panacibacter microcysteis TaxID=2793269 RepID=A0A931H0R1_9BACT|nr:hypothetical protein [Panacibacter microcysteis]MBG9378783.1 hypothetical protein [Panacibacter microcysteis]
MKTKVFELLVDFDGKHYHAEVMVLNASNIFNKPMLRICMDVHQTTCPVFIFYLFSDEPDLFHFPIVVDTAESDKIKLNYYTKKSMLLEHLSALLPLKIKEWGITVEEWSPVKN